MLVTAGKQLQLYSTCRLNKLTLVQIELCHVFAAHVSVCCEKPRQDRYLSVDSLHSVGQYRFLLVTLTLSCFVDKVHLCWYLNYEGTCQQLFGILLLALF